jgi:hypothetical protein
MRLIQFRDGERRAVARIEQNEAIEIAGTETVVELANRALRAGRSLSEHVEKAVEGRRFDYRNLLAGGAVLSPIDHADAAHCFVTGTGLTHTGGAAARDAMHKKTAKNEKENETDSIRMFKLGLEGGKPKGDGPGVQPEWFYKGDGSCVVPPGGDLALPDYALDGGEEPEIAGVYLIAPDGVPIRLGFALGNEFSDHVMERQNYLYLAHSKLRNCAIGPELRTGGLPAQLEGESRIIRDGKKIWSKPFVTGEANMSHAIANLEYHHFKYPLFRRPGDVHIHFFGTSTLSSADGIKTADGDIFEIELPALGAPLRNRLKAVPKAFSYRGVKKL